MRAIGYRRVSDASQVDNHSLAGQSALIFAYADSKGWEVQIREETGGHASGKTTLGRDTLMATLDELDAGEHDALIVTKLDRLARNTLDGLGILARAQRNGWTVVVLDLAIDTSSAIGEAMVTVLLAFAQYERRVILDRTQQGRERARAAGTHLGRRSTVPDDVTMRIFREREQGSTLATIAQNLNADGVPSASGRPWNTGTVSRVARSVTARRLATLTHFPPVAPTT